MLVICILVCVSSCKCKVCQFDEWKITIEASCDSKGALERSCTVCGNTETRETETTEHKYGEWTTEISSTCLQKGIIKHTCVECSYEEFKELEVSDHTYGEWENVKEATCNTNGERTRNCTVCGYTEKQETEMTEHTYGEWTTVSDSTCNQNGVKKRICSVCDYEDTVELELSDQHSFGDWSTKIEATCDSTGIQARNCTICNAEETEVIEKQSHSVDDSTGKCRNCGLQIASAPIYLNESNIKDYLCFDTNTEDVKLESQLLGKEKGEGKIRITASKLQNVSFNDVTLVVSLETSSSGWGTMSREIIVPYDGNVNKTFNIYSFIESYVSDSPTYWLKIESVSGYITVN